MPTNRCYKIPKRRCKPDEWDECENCKVLEVLQLYHKGHIWAIGENQV